MAELKLAGHQTTMFFYSHLYNLWDYDFMNLGNLLAITSYLSCFLHNSE